MVDGLQLAHGEARQQLRHARHHVLAHDRCGASAAAAAVWPAAEVPESATATASAAA